MSFLDKLMFWKKDDEFDFNDDFKDMGDMPNFGTQPPGMQSTPNMSGMDQNMPGQGMPPDMQQNMPPPSMQQGMPSMQQRPSNLNMPQTDFRRMPEPRYEEHVAPDYGKPEMEVISVKLDNLRTSVEVLNQRLQRIEKLVESFAKKGW